MALPNSFSFKYSDKNGYKKARDNSYNNLVNYRKNNFGGVQAAFTDVSALYDQIINAPEFSYDMEKDKLFQLYKQQYNRQGEAQMQNAMGMTGNGYTNSISQIQAQTMYQDMQKQLSEKAVETYQASRDRYNQNLNRLNSQFNIANSIYQAKNNEYQQGWKEAQTGYDIANSVYNNDYSNQYNAKKDNLTYQLNKKRYNG